MKHLALALGLCLGIGMLPFAAQAEVDCSDAGDESDIADCLYEQYDILDAELNAEYQETIAIFEQREAAQDFRPAELVERLRVAQRLWVTYRDANCNMYIWAYEETHQQIFWELSCLEDMTRARMEELIRFQEPGFQEDVF